MAYGDILRSASFTGDDIADLIEGIGSSSHPLAFSTWAPSYSADASMTYTSVTTLIADYIRIGEIGWLSLAASGTTGGTPSNIIYFSSPFNIDADWVTGLAALSGSASDGGTLIGATAFASSTTLIGVKRYDGAVWSAGASRVIRVSGIIKAA